MSDQLFWLCHMKHWFAFSEPAHFEFDKESGGYFANDKGELIYSVIQAGERKPNEQHVQ